MDTRERLVAGTAELLWERGYVGTSPAAILKRTGVGQGSLYHHFTGKQDLAIAAIEANAMTLKVATQAALAPPGTAYERLERWLLREREVLRGCRIGRLAQDPEVYADEALRAPVEEVLGWVRDALAEVIAEGQAAGELNRAVPAQDLASALIATLQGGYVIARAAHDAERFHSAVRGVLALLRTQVLSEGVA